MRGKGRGDIWEWEGMGLGRVCTMYEYHVTDMLSGKEKMCACLYSDC